MLICSVAPRQQRGTLYAMVCFAGGGAPDTGLMVAVFGDGWILRERYRCIMDTCLGDRR